MFLIEIIFWSDSIIIPKINQIYKFDFLKNETLNRKISLFPFFFFYSFLRVELWFTFNKNNSV